MALGPMRRWPVRQQSHQVGFLGGFSLVTFFFRKKKVHNKNSTMCINGSLRKEGAIHRYTECYVSIRRDKSILIFHHIILRSANKKVATGGETQRAPT